MLQYPLMSVWIEGNRPQEPNEMWSGYFIANLKGVFGLGGSKNYNSLCWRETLLGN